MLLCVPPLSQMLLPLDGSRTHLSHHLKASALPSATETCRLLQLPQASLRVGLTMVFLKDACFHHLEGRRSAYLNKCAVTLQAQFRAYRQRKRFLKWRNAATYLQVRKVRRVVWFVFSACAPVMLTSLLLFASIRLGCVTICVLVIAPRWYRLF